MTGEVDLVVHGGDVFDRPRVPASLVYQAFEPLARVADRGIPVFVVPGNHERSRIPHERMASHAGIHVFDRPRTFRLQVAGHDVALSGFPFARRVRDAFPKLLASTGWLDGGARAEIRLLCLHQCFEGATVGPSDFTFRRGRDVVQARDLPRGFGAVVSGHIHRHQVLTTDLGGRGVPCPVLYPGSVERTAFAEMGEAKGYLRLALGAGAVGGGVLLDHTFHHLPARPMLIHEVDAAVAGAEAMAAELRAVIDGAPADAVLRIRVRGEVPATLGGAIAARRLRAMAPATMNVEVVTDARRTSRARRARSAVPRRNGSAGALSLFDGLTG